MKSLNPAPDPPPTSAAAGATTAWRIYHDAGAGVWVDHFDGCWLVQTKDESFPGFLKSLADGVATSIYWRPRDVAAATAPECVWGEPVTERFMVRENGVAYWIDFDAGYSSGIFLDQRLNRLRVEEAVAPGERVLNTFAYTGGFSVIAARAGAVTTSIDLSAPYLEWTWDNFRANGLDPADHFGAKGDTFEWLRAFARQGRTFHGVVLDPPTFSRNRKKTFRADRDYADLAALACGVLESRGWLLCCANTHRLPARRFREDAVAGIERAGRAVETAEMLPMPPEFHGDDYLKSLWVRVR